MEPNNRPAKDAMKLTTSPDEDWSIKDKMPMCSCGLDKVFYICSKPTCPSYRSQNLYCYHCSQLEDQHEHRITSIQSSTEQLKKQWMDFNQSLLDIQQAATALVQEKGRLLAVLDRQAA